MRVQFQADANFNQHIVSGVLRRVPEISFRTGPQAELEGLPDNEVLSRAAKEGRILVTHDRRTMPVHFAHLISQHTSPGVFLVPRHIPVPIVIEELILIWHASEAEDYFDRILTLPL